RHVDGMLGHRQGFLWRSMEMDDAVGIITQVLSVIDRTPTPDESIRPAPEHALNRKRPFVGNLQAGSSTTRTSFVPPTAQNFRIILRSSRIVKKCPTFWFDVRASCLVLIPCPIASIATGTRILQNGTAHAY